MQQGRDLQVEIRGGDAVDAGDPSFILLRARASDEYSPSDGTHLICHH